MFYSKKSSGFTLVELLIVIAILGMLMTVVLVLINPRDILDRSRTRAVSSVTAKVCNAISVCNVSNTATGLCANPTALKPTNVPSGITSVTIGTTSPNTVTVVAAMSGGTACTGTCNPLNGDVVLTGGCKE